MKSTQYLDAVKQHLSISSDYALAKSLKVTKNAVSNVRHEKSHIGYEMAITIAEILGIHPAIVIADTSAERAKDEVLKEIWKEVSAKFGGQSVQFAH